MNNTKFKKTILIDLDGVLNEYKGNYIPNFIPEIKNGAFKFIKKLAQNYNIKIFTTRDKTLVSKWLINNKLNNYITDITNKKDLAFVYIDDRCINFNGNYKDLFDSINNFRPWYKNKT